jgi:prevent-host-death family protein
MEKTVGAFDARRQLGKILKDVAGKGDHYVVNLHGEPVAAVVPIALYERWKRDREALFDEMREISERIDLSPEEADRLTKEAIAAVRQSHRS